jgi:hypothetical protein
LANLVKTNLGVDIGNTNLYKKPYDPEFDRFPLPRGWLMPDLIKFSVDDDQTTWEHISEGPIRRTGEGGSEWEPIKILLEGDEDSNKMNTASNTCLRLTTQVGQAHVATRVPLDLGTNTQPSEPKHMNTHSGKLHGLLPVPHRSDRWPAPARPVTLVRPVDSAGQAGGYSSRTTSIPEGPGTKPPSKHNLH